MPRNREFAGGCSVAIMPRLARERWMEQADYRALAAFRLEIRRFMDFSRRLLDAAGLPPVQYQAMLAIKAQAGEPYSIGDLASELHIKIQTAVELVGRMRESGLVERQPAPTDRRRILLTLTDHGEHILPALASRHFAELRAKTPDFASALARFFPEGERP